MANKNHNEMNEVIWDNYKPRKFFKTITPCPSKKEKNKKKFELSKKGRCKSTRDIKVS